MLPVRCFSCNKVIGRYESAFIRFKELHAGKAIPFTDFFDEFHITRYCCRKIFLTHIDTFPCTETHEPVMSGIEVRKESETKKIILAD